jgi:hypothetical protein
MKHVLERESGGMMCTPSFRKTGSGLPKLLKKKRMKTCGHPQTER